MIEFTRLQEVIKKLRDPQSGCPWDLKQTHKSLLRHLIEETYEYVDAVENEDYSKMEEEIGDVLLQVLLHTTMADEHGKFNLESTSKVLADKLIRRHPHVFHNKDTSITSEQVLHNWQEIKKQEKIDQGIQAIHRIDKSYLSFPALFAADKIGKKTSQIRFDWNTSQEVLEKVEEELLELKDEIQKNDKEKIYEEFGDLTFSIAQLGRHLGLDPEEALRSANRKFINRFNSMENLIKNDCAKLEELSQSQMEIYWHKAKEEEKKMFKRLYNYRLPIIGLTGGIATGKTTTANIFRDKNIPVICADQLIKKIYSQEETFSFILSHFPQTIHNDLINFKALREIVFNNSKAKNLIEFFLYSKLPSIFLEESDKLIKDNKYLIYDVPLLFEKNLQANLDFTICVYCPQEKQIERLIVRDSINNELAKKILHAQIDIEDKKKLANFIIQNDDKPEDDLIKQVERVIITLNQKFF